MTQTSNNLLICGAVIAAIAHASPVAAQGYGSAASASCRSVNGQLVCRGQTAPAARYGSRPYERWDNGTPAIGGGSTGSGSPGPYRFPYSLGGYNSMYGFGR